MSEDDFPWTGSQLRREVVGLIEIVRNIPAERRTVAMQRLLDDLTRAVDEYDRQAGTT